MEKKTEILDNGLHTNIDHTISLFNSIQLLQAYEQAINTNIISTITTTNGIIVHANKKFCEVSKYKESEILGKTHQVINSGYHPKEFFKGMWDTILSGKVWQNEIKNRAQDGSIYWVDTVIVPITDRSGKTTHFLSLRNLITDKKLLEAKKQTYVSSLEVLLVMTSSNIKKPLSDCVAQISEFSEKKQMDKNELKRIADNLTLTVKELEKFREELSTFIREINN